jgi:hypothetical protein
MRSSARGTYNPKSSSLSATTSSSSAQQQQVTEIPDKIKCVFYLIT